MFPYSSSPNFHRAAISAAIALAAGLADPFPLNGQILAAGIGLPTIGVASVPIPTSDCDGDLPKWALTPVPPATSQAWDQYVTESREIPHELAPVSLDTTLSNGTEKEWPS